MEITFVIAHLMGKSQTERDAGVTYASPDLIVSSLFHTSVFFFFLSSTR